MRQVVAFDGPAYVRLGRAAVPAFYDESEEIQLGRRTRSSPGSGRNRDRDGNHGCGGMMAASQLAEEGSRCQSYRHAYHKAD